MANAYNIGVSVMDPYFVHTERQQPKTGITRTQRIGGSFVFFLFMCGIILMCWKINERNKSKDEFSKMMRNLREDLELQELNRKNDMLSKLKNLNITNEMLMELNKLNLTSFMRDSSSLNRVIISHTATDNCFHEVACRNQVEDFKSSPFPDIRAHYMIGGNGRWYKGPNFLDTEGLHAKGSFSDSMCITLIGTFSIFVPPTKQLDATHLLILLSKKWGLLAETYRLYGARQFMDTDSPGDELYEAIQNWEHWSDNIEKYDLTES